MSVSTIMESRDATLLEWIFYKKIHLAFLIMNLFDVRFINQQYMPIMIRIWKTQMRITLK
jgi:hypothetical protein